MNFSVLTGQPLNVVVDFLQNVKPACRCGKPSEYINGAGEFVCPDCCKDESEEKEK